MNWEKWYEETHIPQYDYREDMYDELKEYLKENKSDLLGDCETIEFQELIEKLEENDFTGNISGSKWFNSFKASQCLVGNWALAQEAHEQLCCEFKFEPETCDVIIREYLLGQVLQEVIDNGDEGEYNWIENY